MQLQSHSSQTETSASLIDILSNPIVLDNLGQYLPLSALVRLSRVSKTLYDVIFLTPKVFRYLDLSRCKGAYIPPLAPIDGGGHSWRAERIDENLTEDEFYAGPLRGVLSRLRRKKLLQDVQTLVLDGLASVTNDLLHEIVTDNQYNVRLLSIRKCINVNQPKLQLLLRHICRPGRPANTPRLQGLYIFTDPATDRGSVKSQDSSTGVTLSDGATLGIVPVDKSRHHLLDTDAWYAPTGRMFEQGHSKRTTWEETLQFCKGVIAFDAVLCSHMHDAMADCLHEASSGFLKNKPGIPPIATIALGSEGCTGCGRAPEGAPVWGDSDLFEFPLLSPPPYSGRLVDAVRPPPCYRASTTNHLGRPFELQRLIVSCEWCLHNRHCDSCHRWWCSDCYNPKKSKKLSDLETLSNEGLQFIPSRSDLDPSAGTTGDPVKGPYRYSHLPLTHPNHPRYTPPPKRLLPAVTRECWECGRVCSPCAQVASRQCKCCRGTYCILHNTGCDEKFCDWCMFRGGRGLRELY